MLETLTSILESWDKTYMQTKVHEPGKERATKRTVPLSQVQDQRAIFGYIVDRLREVLPEKERVSKGAKEE